MVLPWTMQLNAIDADIIVTVFDSIDPTGQTVVNLSTATTKNLILTNPAGVDVTKAASFLTDGTDGKLVYTTQTNDINLVGQWTVQAEIDFNTPGYQGRTTIGFFTVKPNS